MKSTNLGEGLWKVGFGELGATLKALQDGGVTLEHMARLRGDPDYAKRVAEFMLRGGIEGSVHHKLARATLGNNFFGVEEWSALYGVNFTTRQLRAVADFPWGEDVLSASCPFVESKTIRETHFAFLGLDRFKGKPLTIRKWQEIHPASGQPRFYFYGQDAWYGGERFATNEVCRLRWYLMFREIVPGSTSKLFEEQQAMLSADYEVPRAVEEATKDILYYRRNGVYLNPTVWARCQDIDSGGSRVGVGDFDAGGLFVSSSLGDYRDSYIGVAASRKFPAQITE